MKIGVTFPTAEFGTDPGAIKEWVQTVEKMGLSHVLTYDHSYWCQQGQPARLEGALSSGNAVSRAVRLVCIHGRSHLED